MIESAEADVRALARRVSVVYHRGVRLAFLSFVCVAIGAPGYAAQEEAAPSVFSKDVRDVWGRLQEDLRGARTLQGRRPEAAAPPGGRSIDLDRCAPEGPQAPAVFSSDFKWGYTLPEMKARYEEVYASGKRLKRRAYWNESAGRMELPFDVDRGGPVALPEGFVRAVIGHIEAAFAASYVDGVFFPDMGHSHFLIPKGLWKEKFDSIPVAQFNRLYEAMMSEPRLEVLYHTAEQLTTRGPDGALVPEDRTQFRYKTRNIVGGNPGPLRVLQNPESPANTVNGVDGYQWWGGGFNISASRDGCFAATVGEKTVRFDLSLFDLEPEPGSSSAAE